nr:hypothetical protein Iba_chr12eCG2200 [Ipomoea batatas]
MVQNEEDGLQLLTLIAFVIWKAGRDEREKRAVVDRAPSPNSDSPPTLRLCSRAHRRHHSSSRYRRLHSSSARRLRSGELTAVAADPSPNAAESSLPSPSQFRRRTRELVATAAESTCCRSRVLRVAVLPVASPSPSQQSTPVTITFAAAESSSAVAD